MGQKVAKSKLRLTGVSTVKQFLFAVLTGILVSLLFTLYSHYRHSAPGWNILNAQTLSAFTTPFGLVFSLLSIFKDFGNRPRRVKILMPSTSDYQSAIINGFELTLSKLSRSVIEAENITPRNRHRDSSNQLEVLRKLRTEKIDGLVIMPSKLSKELLNELEVLHLRGVFIVILEYDLPQDFFKKSTLKLPHIVKPNFKFCGGLLVNKCIEFLNSSEDSFVINVIGPIGEFESTQGVEIQSVMSAIFETNNMNARVSEIYLDDWDSKKASELVALEIQRVSSLFSGLIVVSCGTDRILISLWTILFNDQYNNIRDRIKLIGFDGIRDYRGELIINLSSNSIGTIDTKPFEIGTHSAQLILDECAGDIQNHTGDIQIEPQFTST